MPPRRSRRLICGQFSGACCPTEPQQWHASMLVGVSISKAAAFWVFNSKGSWTSKAAIWLGPFELLASPGTVLPASTRLIAALMDVQ